MVFVSVCILRFDDGFRMRSESGHVKMTDMS